MDISYNFISLVDILGVVQGLLFGSMLVFTHSKKRNATLFLGFFILLFSLEPIPWILRDLGILKEMPQLLLLPVNFHFLAYPLFYIYIQKTSILDQKRPSYWTLALGGPELILGLVLFFLPIAKKTQIQDSSYMTIYFLLGLCYTIYISVLLLKWIYKHSKELENQYTNIVSKTLNWSRVFIYASIGFHILLFINFFADNYTLYSIASVINVILIYWISYKGIVQENVTSLIGQLSISSDTSENNRTLSLSDEKMKSNLTHIKDKGFMSSESAEEVLSVVDDYVKNSKCYIHDNLTIIDIAEATNIHPKRISYAINTMLHINFNSYINNFRIQFAKELLKSEKATRLSIEGIGQEAGFHSKTTFYQTFKRVEGITPAAYRSL